MMIITIVWALINSTILYIGLFFIRFVLVLLGLVMVPLAYPFRTNTSFPKWAWVWDNREDGIFGPTWFNSGQHNFKTCFLWSAIRNPANNMRFVDVFNVEHEPEIEHLVFGDELVPDPSLSRKEKRAIWHFTLVRQKGLWYFSFWYLKAFSKTHFRIRLGWKCTPEWIEEPRAPIYKYSGMTFQFMPWRKG